MDINAIGKAFGGPDFEPFPPPAMGRRYADVDAFFQTEILPKAIELGFTAEEAWLYWQIVPAGVFSWGIDLSDNTGFYTSVCSTLPPACRLVIHTGEPPYRTTLIDIGVK